MARFKDAQVTTTLQGYLQPGEELKHWAYGVKQPSLAIILPLYLLAILPGAIAAALLTKEYIVGMTDRRFIVLQVNGKLEVKEVLEYRLDSLPQVKADTGSIFTVIKIDDAQRPFEAKFHRMGMTENRSHSMAMAERLTGATI